MSLVNTQLNWEEYYIQESLDLEEKMAFLDISQLNKSRIRIAFENNILSWENYITWYSQNLPCSLLEISNDNQFFDQLVKNSSDTIKIFSDFDSWSEDLLPLQKWNDSLIVLGVQFNEKLLELENVIFVAAHPELMTRLHDEVMSRQTNSETSDLDQLEDLLNESVSKDLLDNINLEVEAPQINFSQLSIDPSEKTNAEEFTNVTDIQNIEFWEYVTDRHDEYSFEAKKQFDAYVVLKIAAGRTKVFKSDEDFFSSGVKEDQLVFDIKEDNPFHKVFYSEKSEVFNVSQLEKNLGNYKYMCVSALKRGSDVLGFLVGLKKTNLSEKDQNLLDDLAKESA